MRAMLRMMVMLTVGLAGVGATLAQAPGWKYVEAGFTSINPEGADSVDGWFAGATWEFGSTEDSKFHAFGEFGEVDEDTNWSAGGGWHGLLGEAADIVGEAAFVDLDEVDGFRVTGGVRWMLLERLELNGFLNYSDLDTFDQTSLEVGGVFDFSRRFGVGASYDHGDDFDTTRVFLRYNFGSR